MDVREKAELARNASIDLAPLKSEKKDKILDSIACALQKNRKKIIDANKADLKNAEGKISKALFDRLKLSEAKFEQIVKGVQSVKEQPDPVGRTLAALELDSGLELYQVSCPMGVICAIFEARPDALVQISTLCLKSGNAVILKGGSEAAETNRAIFSLIRKAVGDNSINPEAVQLIETREEVKGLLALDDVIDLIIPRGSNEFVRFIQDNTRIPVLGHSSGICHIYVDSSADFGKAVNVCFDAKVQYPAVCNAMETMLLHSKIAGKFLPLIGKKFEAADVQLFADEKAKKIFGSAGVRAFSASAQSWRTEYNDLKLNVKVVESIGEAIEHINRYGSRHTDAIITEDREKAREFISRVDSSSVMWNASTRFADGYRYGKGSEVGISTSKIHARGPAGMESLITYKYIVVGKGHIVAPYAGENPKAFSHKKLEKEW